MKLSIIIVNYRSASYILHAIESAYQFESAANFEWIVVDNNSNDNSRELLTARFPAILWIDMGYNAGFARANNEGIRRSRGDAVLLLNPDTIVRDDAIARCLQRFTTSSCVACSVQLLFPDLSPQISGNFFMKGGINHLLPLPYWGSFLKMIALSLGTKKPNVPEARSEEKVDWINGAFLMVKKSAIARAGMMDEDFFLYAEEAEWCSRLQKTGDLCIYGDIRMIHIQGEAINQAAGTSYKGYSNLFDRKGLQLMVSNHVRIRKQYGSGWFLFQLLNVTISLPVFFAGSLLERLFRGRKIQWQDIKGLAKNTTALWKLTPTIIRNKPHFYKVL